MTEISGPARLAANPELKSIGQGDEKRYVCEMRVRFLNGKPKKDSDEWEDQGFWTNVNLWGKSAEVAARLFVKGDRVTLIGNLIERSWPDQDDPDKIHNALQVDANFIAPYLPDLESLCYKPRQPWSDRAADSAAAGAG